MSEDVQEDAAGLISFLCANGDYPDQYWSINSGAQFKVIRGRSQPSGNVNGQTIYIKVTETGGFAVANLDNSNGRLRIIESLTAGRWSVSTTGPLTVTCSGVTFKENADEGEVPAPPEESTHAE